jgi:hypothetical protein
LDFSNNGKTEPISKANGTFNMIKTDGTIDMSSGLMAGISTQEELGPIGSRVIFWFDANGGILDKASYRIEDDVLIWVGGEIEMLNNYNFKKQQ